MRHRSQIPQKPIRFEVRTLYFEPVRGVADSIILEKGINYAEQSQGAREDMSHTARVVAALSPAKRVKMCYEKRRILAVSLIQIDVHEFPYLQEAAYKHLSACAQINYSAW